MKNRIHMYSEFDEIVFEIEVQNVGSDPPVIWARAGDSAVSLTLCKADRDKLRAALDEADAIAELERTK